MTAPRPVPTRSHASSPTSQHSTLSSQNAALLGAATAFGRPKPKARAPSNTHMGAIGALAAANGAATATKTPSPEYYSGRSPAPIITPASTGGTGQNVKSVTTKETPFLEQRKTPNLWPPAPARRGRTKSPSAQAASLAATRAPPSPATDTSASRPRAETSQKLPVTPKPRRLSSGYHNKAMRSDTDGAPDIRSIPSTTSLVDFFERRLGASQPSGKRPEPIVIKSSNDLALRSPKPVRTSGHISSVFHMELEGPKSPPKPTEIHSADGVSEFEPKDGTRSSSSPYASASEDISPSSSPPETRKRHSVAAPKAALLDPPNPERGRQRPAPSPLRYTATEPVSVDKQSKKSLTTPPETLSPPSHSLKSLPAQYNKLFPPKLAPSMTSDQLANAMVASSLASSRAPSPRKAETPRPLSRQQRHHTFSLSRTPSPAKRGMRHTLRKAETDSSDDEDQDRLHPYSKHKRKKHVRRHPNKHHEGDRKRWRDAVTERERKRYEGVWAANKGMLCSFTMGEQNLFAQAPDSQRALSMKNAVTDQVSNIIVRDIWSRSRLPETVLETVWDLVDNDNVGRLNKEEFVVGMWLIDQRLKGRKLPVKVSDTVWTSVKALQGIKIKR